MTNIFVKRNITLTRKVVNTKIQKNEKEKRMALLLGRHLYNENYSIQNKKECVQMGKRKRKQSIEKKNKYRKRILRNKWDILGDLLKVGWLMLCLLGMCVLCAYWSFLLLTNMVKERIEIAQKASAYEVAEGEIQSVDVKKYYIHYHYKGSHDSLDRKYVGEITYTDKNGEAKQLTSSEVDKKLKAGKRIKVAYHTTDPTDADIACFDIWVFSYIPCYLKSYNGLHVILLVATVFAAFAFGWLVWLFIVLVLYGEYEYLR